MPSDWKCTSCGAKLELTNKKNAVCPFCGTVNSREKHAPKPGTIECVQCGEENPRESQFCSTCGSELYFTCPKCAKLNPAGSVHCPQCGANIAQEIRNWQIKQSEAQTKKVEAKRKRKKVFRTIMLTFLSLVVFIVVAVALINLKQESDWNRYTTSQTATAQAFYTDAPFRWMDDSGNLEILIEPNIGIFQSGSICINATFINRTAQDCEFQKDLIYMEDNLGNTYIEGMAGIFEDGYFETVPANSSYPISGIFSESIPPGATTFTIHYPDFCGVPVDSIEIDLSSPWAALEYYEY